MLTVASDVVMIYLYDNFFTTCLYMPNLLRHS